MKTSHFVCIILGVFGLFGLASYNGLVGFQEQVNQRLSQVENVYQRRNDLIPNLVKTVQGYAAHEKGVFEAVTNARTQVGQIKLGDNPSPEVLAQFTKVQGELGSALTRLLAVAEAYPNLKADTQFSKLQDELAGSENRIAVARMEAQKAIQIYNTKIRSFPTNLIAGAFGFVKQEYFATTEGAHVVPEVKF